MFSDVGTRELCFRNFGQGDIDGCDLEVHEGAEFCVDGAHGCDNDALIDPSGNDETDERRPSVCCSCSGKWVDQAFQKGDVLGDISADSQGIDEMLAAGRGCVEIELHAPLHTAGILVLQERMRLQRDGVLGICCLQGSLVDGLGIEHDLERFGFVDVDERDFADKPRGIDADTASEREFFCR